jgi:hypothetical protein
MKAMNRNPGQIRYATRIGTLKESDLAAAGETIANYRRPNNDKHDEIPIETEVLLRPGMTVKLVSDHPGLPDVPTYLVKNANSGIKPELELEMLGDSKRYGKAAQIKITGKDSIKNIGNITDDAVVNVNHPRISRFHATLYFDESQKSWVYNTLQEPPIIGIGNQFLNRMGDMPKRVAGTTPNDARREIAEIDALIDNMQNNKGSMQNALELMKKVQHLELATVFTKPEDIHHGGRTTDSQRGYRNWLHAYKLLYKEDISAADMKGLNLAMDAMNKMAEEREIIADIESYAASYFPRLTSAKPADILKACRESQYNCDMNELVNGQLAPLEKIPPEATIIASGFRGHHTVTKIEKDDKGYLVTTYNTGAELIYADDGENALSKYSRHLNKDVKIEDFVRLIDERKVRRQYQADSDKIDTAIQSMVGKIEVFEIAPPQHKGNCTTRSTREMLRDMIAPERFAHLHRHVSNPDLCNPADILAALQMRRDALALIAPMERPQSQADWSQSVSDFRASERSHAPEPGKIFRSPGSFTNRL